MTTPLADLHSVCADIHDRWDSDQRSGKLLVALQGGLGNYDPRVTRIRQALDSFHELRESLERLVHVADNASASRDEVIAAVRRADMALLRAEGK